MVLVSSILLTGTIFFILVHNYALGQKIFLFFRKLRGTQFYEGESLGAENWIIFLYILLPSIFILCTGISLFLVRKISINWRKRKTV